MDARSHFESDGTKIDTTPPHYSVKHSILPEDSA